MARTLTLPLVLLVKNFGSRQLKTFSRDLQFARKTTQRVAKSMGSQFSDVTAVMQGLLVATAAVGAGIAKIGLRAGKFNQNIAAAAFATEATTAQLQELRTAAIGSDVALRGIKPTDAALALREIGAEGLNATEAVELLIPALDLARASFFELSPQKAGGLLVQTMRIFDIETSKAAATVDKLTRTGNISAVTLDKMGLFMGIAATGAQAIGANLTDTLATAALIRGVIPRVERGATAFRGFADDLADANRRVKLEQELGVKAVNEATGEFRNHFDVILDVISATEGMTKAQREAKLQSVFQIEAIAGLRAVMVALKKGMKDAEGNTFKMADAIAFLRKEINVSTGDTKRLVTSQVNTIAGAFEALAAAGDSLAVGLGDSLSILVKGLLLVAEGVAKLGSFFLGLPRPVKFVIGVLLALAAMAGFVAASVLLIGLSFGSLRIAALVAIPAIRAFFLSIVLGARAALVKLGIIGAILLGLGFLLDATGALDALLGAEEADVASITPTAEQIGGTPKLGEDGIPAFGGLEAGFKAAGGGKIAKEGTLQTSPQMLALMQQMVDEQREMNRRELVVEADRKEIARLVERQQSLDAQRNFDRPSRPG